MAPRAHDGSPSSSSYHHRRGSALGAALGWLLACALGAREAWSGAGSNARSGASPRARNGARAFVLRVDLTFVDAADARALVRAWGEAADWCRAREPFLLHYEIAQSDAEPLKYSIYERYRTKEDYLGPHKSSEAFRKFRPQMRALQDAGKLVVSGESFVELGVGFVS